MPRRRAQPIARCASGQDVTSVRVEDRGGQKFIYGYYYDPEKKRTRKCYVGPADPEYVIGSMPAAFLLEPRTWAVALRAAAVATARNLATYGPERLRDLVEALALALRDIANEQPSVREVVREALKDVLGEDRGQGVVPA